MSQKMCCSGKRFSGNVEWIRAHLKDILKRDIQNDDECLCPTLMVSYLHGYSFLTSHIKETGQIEIIPQTILSPGCISHIIIFLVMVHIFKYEILWFKY